MKNVYHVGSGELTFDIIERIINENLKLELALEAKELSLIHICHKWRLRYGMRW